MNQKNKIACQSKQADSDFVFLRLLWDWGNLSYYGLSPDFKALFKRQYSKLVAQ